MTIDDPNGAPTAAEPEDSAATQPQVDRRGLLKGMTAGGLATTIGVGAGGAAALQTLRPHRALAQATGPVKGGFIEDESGNLSVYGIQKLHAAQLAVKEINEGKTLKGAAGIGAGQLGVEGSIATNPPVISKEGTGLDVVNDGGAKGKTDLVFDEDADVLVDSGDKGVLGREVQLV